MIKLTITYNGLFICYVKFTVFAEDIADLVESYELNGYDVKRESE